MTTEDHPYNFPIKQVGHKKPRIIMQMSQAHITALKNTAAIETKRLGRKVSDGTLAEVLMFRSDPESRRIRALASKELTTQLNKEQRRERQAQQPKQQETS